MSKYIFGFYKKEDKKYLLKVIIDGVNDGDEIWAETTKAVYTYAKNNFKEEDTCNLEYTEEDGKYKVSRITKGNGTTTKTKEVDDTVSEYKCEECGKTLKDGKYKKCYTCNQKNPVKKTAKKISTGDFRTPEQITKDYLANSTGLVVKGALIGCQGHLNPNNVTEVVTTLMEVVYKKFQELVK